MSPQTPGDQDQQPNWTCVLLHIQVEPKNSHLEKNGCFLSEVGWQSFERMTLLFIWQIIKLNSFLSKTLLTLFFNYYWAQGTGFWITYLSRHLNSWCLQSYLWSFPWSSQVSSRLQGGESTQRDRMWGRCRQDGSQGPGLPQFPPGWQLRPRQIQPSVSFLLGSAAAMKNSQPSCSNSLCPQPSTDGGLLCW
jgi:hypothetical protein